MKTPRSFDHQCTRKQKPHLTSVTTYHALVPYCSEPPRAQGQGSLEDKIPGAPEHSDFGFPLPHPLPPQSTAGDFLFKAIWRNIDLQLS